MLSLAIFAPAQGGITTVAVFLNKLFHPGNAPLPHYCKAAIDALVLDVHSARVVGLDGANLLVALLLDVLASLPEFQGLAAAGDGASAGGASGGGTSSGTSGGGTTSTTGSTSSSTTTPTSGGGGDDEGSSRGEIMRLVTRVRADLAQPAAAGGGEDPEPVAGETAEDKLVREIVTKLRGRRAVSRNAELVKLAA
ncbi:MAG: hypothetical protein AAFS07_19345, partial [Pseudomonadota bacterium]